MRLNGVLMKTLRCAECRWTSLSSAHSWLSSPLVLTPLIIPNTVLCEAPAGSGELEKHWCKESIAWVFAGRHDTRSAEHFSRVLFLQPGRRNRAQAVVYSRLLPPSPQTEEYFKVLRPAVPGILDLHPDTRPWTAWSLW